MNRRLLLLVTSPALLLGVALVVACTVSVVAINASQERLFDSMNNKVASRHAAHEMEVAVHMLRFHFLVNLMKPSPAHDGTIRLDHRQFEENLEQAKKLCPPGYEHLVKKIEDSYERYRDKLTSDQAGQRAFTREELLKWIDEHPVQQVIGPCEELLEANRKMVEEAFDESEHLNHAAKIILLLLGIVGPVGGLFSGYYTARGLSRSIARLLVRVQDVHLQIAPEESVIDLQVSQNIDELHRQLEVVLKRVQGLVERLHQHQREQMRSEQLAAVGQLASSVAHEIRNPLTAMKWLVDNAISSYPDEPISMEDLSVLKGEIERMNQSVQVMLDFTRPPKAVRSRGDLREAVHHALELIRGRKRQMGVRAECDLPGQPVWAEFDASQIKSVLVNLLMNALEAMPRGGVVRLQLHLPEMNQIRLVVEDTGHGIPREMLTTVFEPFVSTKATGTGLGLAVTKRLIEEHGGHITVENRPEGGARFTITLPATMNTNGEHRKENSNHAKPAIVDHR
jgi:signal transduction histidine kinase